MTKKAKKVKMQMKNETGATSILVLFMMIVLITMGTFAITAAQSNITFSERVLDWNEEYYTLDSKAEEFLFDLDEVLLDTAMKAKEEANSTGEYDTLYKEYVKQSLKNFKHEIEIKESADLTIDANFTGEDEIAHLLVSLIIKTPTEDNPRRYQIKTWREWQEPFSYDEEIEFWDGNLDDFLD